MRDKMKRRLEIEKMHFEMLGWSVKKLLLSFALVLMAWPMVVTFVNAYLWQESGDINRLIVYNMAFFLALPFGFWGNKLVLERVHVLKAYWLGTVLQGLSAWLVVFAPSTNIMRLGLYGLFFGLGSGLYWGNKNYLSLRLTRGKSRMYYNNIEQAMDLVINIVMPVLVGWFLVLGEMNGWYSKELAYRAMLLVGLVLLIVAGWVIQGANIKDFQVKRVWLKKVSKSWWKVRILHIVSNVTTGLWFFLPGVLVLSLIGEEGILGTVASVTSALSAIVLYVIGRKIMINNAWKIVWLGSVLALVGTGILAWQWSVVGVLVYWAMDEVGRALSWSSSYSVVMEVMDREEGAAELESQYAYVCDNELMFNIGRMIGVGLFLLLWRWGGQEVAMRYVLLVAAVLQVMVMGLLKKLNEEVMEG